MSTYTSPKTCNSLSSSSALLKLSRHFPPAPQDSLLPGNIFIPLATSLLAPQIRHFGDIVCVYKSHLLTYLHLMLLCVVGSARYSVFSGGGQFIVNSLSGQILTNGQLDHETMSSYLLTITAELLTDSSLFTHTQVTHL